MLAICGYDVVVSSTTVQPKTFFMAIEMSMSIRYSLKVPHLSLFYKVLGDFSTDCGEVK